MALLCIDGASFPRHRAHLSFPVIASPQGVAIQCNGRNQNDTAAGPASGLPRRCAPRNDRKMNRHRERFLSVTANTVKRSSATVASAAPVARAAME